MLKRGYSSPRPPAPRSRRDCRIDCLRLCSRRGPWRYGKRYGIPGNVPHVGGAVVRVGQGHDLVWNREVRY